MKRFLGTAALCLLSVGMATQAGAVGLNPKGLGQVLLYPYYTVNKNQDTYFTVVNSSDVGKVAKVRFLEGYNGRSVLDFTLYLSAHDVWAATISATDAAATSGARLSWSDKSCIDSFPKNPYPFLPYAYDGTQASLGTPADSGPQTIDRTREGHIEIIALGDIVPGSNLETAITHVQPSSSAPNTGVPAAATGAAGNCPGIGALALAAGAIVTPTSGLFGSAAIINVGEGTFYPYNSDALTGFTSVPLLTNTAIEHGLLSEANSPEATHGVARAYLAADEGRPLELDYARGIDAVSAVLMADAIQNEYLVGAGLGANTDWVVTFPTKRYYVDKQLYPASPTLPFESPFSTGKSTISSDRSIWDREEGRPSLLCAPLDPDCEGIRSQGALGYEANVISFLDDPSAADASGVLGSRLRANIKPFGDSGWAKLDLFGTGAHTLPSGKTGNGTELPLPGLPVAGFMVYNIINSNAQPGKLANYSGVFPHRANLSCDNLATTDKDICP